MVQSGDFPHGALNAKSFHKERKFVTTTFGRISYIERGSGEAAVFLHGFPLNGFQWRGAIERLSPNRRCIAPDFLGMGYTEVNPGQGVAPDDQTVMILGMMDELGLGTVDLVANDSGGAVAQLILARHPDRVRTLLLTNCDTEIDSPPPSLIPVIELSKKGQFVDRWLAPWLLDKPLARSASGIGGMCYTDPLHPSDEAIDCYFSPLVSSSERKSLVHAYAIALERNPLTGIGPLLKKTHQPVRILWGTADTIFSSGSPDFLSQAFGNSKGVRRLPGSKLFWPEELPDVIAEEAITLWKHS
jgi:pimeloyl-ACP methyl ester carboxylesterase